MQRLPATLLVTALVAASVMGGAIGASASQAAATDVTWSLEPSSESGSDGRVSLRHTIDGGAAATDFVALHNLSEQAVTFAVYASDGILTPDGNFDLLASEERPSDGGSWVTIGSPTGASTRDDGGILLEVAAATTVVIPLTIDVPTDATPGDHPAGVVAEPVASDDSAVQVASRVGVRLHLRVAGEVVATLVPGEIRASFEPSWNPFMPGTVVVDYTVVNDGNVRLGAQASTSISGAFGAARSESATELREILPGQSTQGSVRVPVWPLLVGWGDVTAIPLVVGEDLFDGSLTPVSTAFMVWTPPYSQLVLLVILAAVIAVVVRLRRRSADRVQARIVAAVAAATADPGHTELSADWPEPSKDPDGTMAPSSAHRAVGSG